MEQLVKIMSIIRLSRTYPRVDYPGIGLHCYYFSRNIKKPTVIFTKQMDSSPVGIPENVDFQEIGYADLSFQREKEKGVRLLSILFSKFFGEIVFSWRTIRYLKKNKVNVELIHLHSINYLLTAVFISKLYHAPFVMNFGGTDLLRLRKYRFLQWFARQSSKVLYVAKSMENDLLNFFSKEQLVHMGNGVDLQQFEPSKTARLKQFIAIGNLRWQKGYRFLISAFKQVVERYPSYQLVIAGEGKDRDSLESQIAELDMIENVKLIGMQSRQSIAEHLNSSRALVMSSVAEGFPKAMIEAIACSTPVVVTDVGECKYIAQDVGIVVMPNDINALAKALIQIISDDQGWERYSLKCLEVRKNFEWKNMTDRVNNAYNEVVDFTQ